MPEVCAARVAGSVAASARLAEPGRGLLPFRGEPEEVFAICTPSCVGLHTHVGGCPDRKGEVVARTLHCSGARCRRDGHTTSRSRTQAKRALRQPTGAIGRLTVSATRVRHSCVLAEPRDRRAERRRSEPDGRRLAPLGPAQFLHSLDSSETFEGWVGGSSYPWASKVSPDPSSSARQS